MTPPSTIAHYRITSKLGEGGMGAVYCATDTKLNREAAIKVLPDALGNDPDYLARFTREAQVLASLNHPNIAIIYGVEERALVMELVPGATLEERIAAGPIPIDEALGIARQIAEALEAAHAATGRFAAVRVSPDGKRLLYWQAGAEQNDIWTLDIALGTTTRMTFGGQGASPASWSPDDKHLIYWGQGKVWWLRSDGGGQPQPLLNSVGAYFEVAPDGRHMLIEDKTGLRIASLEDGGGDRPRVGEPQDLHQSGTIGGTVLSPDGKWVAYTSSESGYAEVYVRPFPGPGGKWQVSGNHGNHPGWGRGEIFFLGDDNRLQSAPYTVSGDTFHPGAVHAWGSVRVSGLLGGRNYDVMPDGKHVVGLFNDEPAVESKAPGQITVMLNFFDELKRKVGKK